MTINEAIETLRYEIDEECHCDYIADEIRFLIAQYESLSAQEEKAHNYCKNHCEPKYKTEICMLKKNLEEAHIDIREKQAEIEALINGQETLQKYIAEQKAEIERLQEEIELLHSDYTYKFVKEKAKAEAVKEFAERLKGDNFKVPVDAFTSAYVLGDDDIDQIAKEMVGDGK